MYLLKRVKVLHIQHVMLLDFGCLMISSIPFLYDMSCLDQQLDGGAESFLFKYKKEEELLAHVNRERIPFAYLENSARNNLFVNLMSLEH